VQTAPCKHASTLFHSEATLMLSMVMLVGGTLHPSPYRRSPLGASSANTTRELCFMGRSRPGPAEEIGGRGPQISGRLRASTVTQPRVCVARLGQGGMQGESTRR